MGKCRITKPHGSHHTCRLLKRYLFCLLSSSWKRTQRKATDGPFLIKKDNPMSKKHKSKKAVSKMTEKPVVIEQAEESVNPVTVEKETQPTIPSTLSQGPEPTPIIPNEFHPYLFLWGQLKLWLENTKTETVGLSSLPLPFCDKLIVERYNTLCLTESVMKQLEDMAKLDSEKVIGEA